MGDSRETEEDFTSRAPDFAGEKARGLQNPLAQRYSNN
jgi:hypothetical protein